MKKRSYLVVTVFLMFLLFISFVFAALNDLWVICDRGRYAQQDDVTGKYCCTDGTNDYWQTDSCCTDNDGDYYVAEDIDIEVCGDVCGPGNDETCMGNNDCDDTPDGADGDPGNADDGANINPGAPENTDYSCSDGIDNNCNELIDCHDTENCHGKKSSDGSYCCTTRTIFGDCFRVDGGDCGDVICNNDINQCQVDENMDKCPRTTGDCGIFKNSCASPPNSEALFCEYTARNARCGCGQYCTILFDCRTVGCSQPFLDWNLCLSDYGGLANCACHGCTTCPSTSLGASKEIGSEICS